jgi:DNA-binding transcriptional regulator YiaG
MPMTADQLNKIMHDVQIRQLDLSDMFNITTRQVRRWQAGQATIPAPIVVLMRLLASGLISPAQVAELRREGRPKRKDAA